MHFMEAIRYRSIPGAAVYLSLTQRCPLRCRHCCTGSLMSSQQHEESIFEDFVASFTSSSHPEIVFLTGGEALLRPKLVSRIAELSHSVGTRVSLISGMYFLRNRSVPPVVRTAIHQVDHLTASLDVFHEERVSRTAVLRFLDELLDQGQDVSLQVVGTDDQDPYLAEVTRDAVEATGGRMPIFVSRLANVGRAEELFDHVPPVDIDIPAAPDLLPCAMATWPVVTYDGTVFGCCNQGAIDRGGPGHLLLGHARDGWPMIRDRCLNDPFLRAVRTVGPRVLASDAGTPVTASYCGTCVKLADSSSRSSEVFTEIVTAPRFATMEAAMQRIAELRGGADFVRRYGSPKYADLAFLGMPQQEGVAI